MEQEPGTVAKSGTLGTLTNANRVCVCECTCLQSTCSSRGQSELALDTLLQISAEVKKVYLIFIKCICTFLYDFKVLK